MVNVGAGAGSYEPATTRAALEPSLVMVRQRAPDSAPVVCGVAEELPFRDAHFDAGLAVLTVHHWSDPRRGLAELRRVAKRQAVVTWDPEVFSRGLWLVRDYLPELVDRERDLATLPTVLDGLGSCRIESLPVPADCADGFLGAYWRRPEAYLDPALRAGTSGFALLDPVLVETAMDRLEDDLESGRWAARHGDLLERDEIDLGYRLVVHDGP